MLKIRGLSVYMSKQSGKKAVVTKEVKLLATIGLSEDKEDACSLDDEFPPKIRDSDAKQTNQYVKKSDSKKPKQTGKTSKQSAKKEEASVSDSDHLNIVKKVRKEKEPTV
ncbi:hypothetical protein Tco_0789466 [Tanacetum coccineum]